MGSVPLDFDNLLQAVHDRKVPLRVELADVSRAEPALRVERFVGGFRVVEVAPEKEFRAEVSRRISVCRFSGEHEESGEGRTECTPRPARQR